MTNDQKWCYFKIRTILSPQIGDEESAPEYFVNMDAGGILGGVAPRLSDTVAGLSNCVHNF